MTNNRLSRIERFRFYLEDQGKQLTKERKLIAEFVFEANPPTDGDSWDDFVVRHFCHKKNRPRISRATIYRTLEQLKEAGLIE